MAAFLLPLVSGALSQLLPVWRYSGRRTPLHDRAREVLVNRGAMRALLFIGGGVLLALGHNEGLADGRRAAVVSIRAHYCCGPMKSATSGLPAKAGNPCWRVIHPLETGFAGVCAKSALEPQPYTIAGQSIALSVFRCRYRSRSCVGQCRAWGMVNLRFGESLLFHLSGHDHALYLDSRRFTGISWKHLY